MHICNCGIGWMYLNLKIVPSLSHHGFNAVGVEIDETSIGTQNGIL